MFTVSVTSEFNAAHMLRDYKGKCENLHGHNWLVEASIKGNELNETGMLVDFGDLRTHLTKVLEKLDHRFINESDYFKKINPTSENIAKYIYDELKNIYKELSKITVWETAGSRASYEE